MAAIPRTRRAGGRLGAALAAVLVAALALGVALLSVAAGAEREYAGGPAVPALIVVVGWAFAAAGCYAWRRAPDNRVGALLVAFGFTVLLTGFFISDEPLLYLVASIADPLAIAVFLHLLLAFPTGRLGARADRIVVAAAYATAVVGQLGTLLFDADLGDADCAGCPRNLALIEHVDAIATLAQATKQIVGLGLVLVGIGLTLRRARAAGAAGRRAFAPLLAAGSAVLALGVISAAAQNLDAGADAERVAQLVFIAAFATLPAAFLIGLLRARALRATSVTGLLERLTAERGGDVGAALAEALGDPSLTVAYWLPDAAAYVDRDGRPFALPGERDGAVATELVHQGRRVGALVHDPALATDGALLSAVAGAAALALENDRLEVELRARVEALRRSRARIVEAGDVERRRLGRDLHDGAQQRLISVLLELKLAEERWQAEPDAARELVGSALGHARAAVDELRELAAGIHPAVLSQRGLDAAVETLAARSPVPVELDVALADRLPATVETAAYFVVSEALANVAKHAQATHARVTIAADGPAAVVVEIADDGAGGADADGGSGLRGLADRVGALDGTIAWQSPDGGGTVVRARFPLT